MSRYEVIPVGDLWAVIDLEVERSEEISQLMSSGLQLDEAVAEAAHVVAERFQNQEAAQEYSDQMNQETFEAGE
ncbi:hypothetical protein [Halomonas elongata]|uniref:hypothetical protein n=1 Tax=Halomonas elongata TaxID=2746 RepID=UPI00186B7260|nr:hypothetical protein [Halomonas elongata]MBW5802033.1 hypothetical protein [Halomonas elongata]